MRIRLDKYLADMQVGTRSQVKEYIRKHRICVDGTIVSSPEYKIDSEAVNVTFDGNPITYVEFEYFMLNKPAGTVSATSDKKAVTVLDLIDTKSRKDLFPVGRLDKDTEGLLLLTNDGTLAHDLLSPKKHVDKTYFARISGTVDESTVEMFTQGVVIDDGIDEGFKSLPAKLMILKGQPEPEVLVTIQEGRFHQVKRMFSAVGAQVVFLKRLSMGPIVLDEALQPGEYRKLTTSEIQALYAHKNTVTQK